MKVLVDTCIWSLAFRKKQKDSADTVILETLNQLILTDNAVIIGTIRQEILSGIRHDEQFDKLKSKMSIFEDLQVTTTDYEMASYCYNQCRKNGIQGSAIDFLICAVAMNKNIAIFTTDRDFSHYQTVLDFKLFKV